MAASCDGFSKIFESPAEKASMIDPISSWSQIKPPANATAASSFHEIFGELHFQENKPSPPLPPPPPPHAKPATLPHATSANGRGSLQLCTEGLGFESSADVDDDCVEASSDYCSVIERGSASKGANRYRYGLSRSFCSGTRQKSGGGEFPPPITSNGVCLRSYREDGRFVLREIRVPTHELLHASREDGRLKLHFIHPKDEASVRGGEDQAKEEVSC